MGVGVVIVNQKSPKPVVRPVLEGRPEDIPAPAERVSCRSPQHATYVFAGSILWVAL